MNPAESAIDALTGRGELGWLLLSGRGGGPITAEVLLDSPGLGCCEDGFVWDAGVVRDIEDLPVVAIEFTSGGDIEVWRVSGRKRRGKSGSWMGSLQEGCEVSQVGF